MGLGNILLLSQAAAYTVALISSLCVAIPMGFHMSSFKGHCLLFTDGEFIEDDGRFEPNWASRFYCNYTMVIGCLLFFIALVQNIRMLINLAHSTDSSFVSAFVDTLVATVVVILVLANSILVTIGFSKWCDAVTQRFVSCETAAAAMQIGLNSGISPHGFFVEIGTVQFGIWLSFVTWVLVLVLNGRKLFIYHERENMIVSMARERLRYASPGYSNSWRTEGSPQDRLGF